MPSIALLDNIPDAVLAATFGGLAFALGWVRKVATQAEQASELARKNAGRLDAVEAKILTLHDTTLRHGEWFREIRDGIKRVEKAIDRMTHKGDE